MPPILFEAALNLVFPPLCRSCERVLEIDDHQVLCPKCLSKSHLIPDPRCDRCGAPLRESQASDRGTPPTPHCVRCPSSTVHFERVACAVEYVPPFRELIHEFKFRGSERVQKILIEWFLQGAARDFGEQDFDCVVPVPLHWWRRFQREFNQAEILGRALAEEWSVPILPSALKRNRATVAQSKLPGKWRERNIARAFTAGKESVTGRSVLLVDDVMTSGATLSECARVLRGEGAESVKAFTLARRL